MLTVSEIRDGAGYASYLLAGESVGEHIGLGSARLGLHGEVTAAQLHAMCAGLDPSTGKTLTQRMEKDRTVGVEWMLSAPKSVSVMALVEGDDRLVEAFRQSVLETMAEAEKEIKARVRRFGQVKDRDTGEMLGQLYIHTTTREIEGTVCPQLHAHALVQNATFDDHEGKWKAAKQHFLMKHAPYFEADFRSRLADKVAELGYAVRTEGKSFEIAVKPEVVKEFSRSTERINAIAEEMDATIKQKARIGPKTRGKKLKVELDQAREEWKARLSPEQLGELSATREAATERKVEREEIKAPDIRKAWQHERDVMTAKRLPVDKVPLKRLASAVMRDFYGKAKPEQVHEAIQASGMRIKDGMVSKPRPRFTDRVRRRIHERIVQAREQVMAVVQRQAMRY